MTHMTVILRQFNKVVSSATVACEERQICGNVVLNKELILLCNYYSKTGEDI